MPPINDESAKKDSSVQRRHFTKRMPIFRPHGPRNLQENQGHMHKFHGKTRDSQATWAFEPKNGWFV